MEKSLHQALSWSDFLKHRLEARPELREGLLQDCQHPVTPDKLLHWLAELGTSPRDFPPPDISTCRRQLRQLRARVMQTLIVRDIEYHAPLEEIITAMSALADLCVNMAYRCVMHELVGTFGSPIDSQTGLPMEMIILGMGKLGGEELNVSSDIDLIMLYAEEGETQGGRRSLSHHEFFSRLTQKMMPILSEPDADGFVFRTDLRLRPDGDGSPLAWSLSALEHYLITQGREWERYAWLKARVIKVSYFENSQGHADLQLLESLRKPFVYRKYFDFDALSALRQLREQIRQEWQRKVNSKGMSATQNIKLGEGGIREIEFIVQLIQLIRGGRLPSLQQRSLLKALQAEYKAGLIPLDMKEALEKAYRFLRRLEHFLQYQQDAQTHLLPTDPETLERLAQSMGMRVEEFQENLSQHRHFVATTFAHVFRLLGMQEDETPPIPETPTPTSGSVDEAHDNLLIERYNTLLKSQRIKQLSPSTQKRLHSLLPSLLAAASQTKQASLVFNYLADLIETIAQRSAYIALLVEYPEIVQRLARLMAASPFAAQFLIKHPILLDSLIDWRTLLQAIDLPSIATQLHQELSACLIDDNKVDIERQMNLMRDTQKMVEFQLLAQDLEGELSVEHLADYLSALADLLLEESLYRTWEKLRHTSKYPLPEKANFAIISYGKLGGKELGYASDLDLVFIFEDNHENAVETYIKLGRHLNSWLSSMTPSGRMYEVDLRLRPDGDAGLLAVSMEGFSRYQHETAWVWEHQALTRGRFSAGNRALGDKFEQLRRDILSKVRDIPTLKKDIVQMRLKMQNAHTHSSELFDIKHDRGGMIDIEFITQFLVLAYSHAYPTLLENLGNIALLKIAAEAGLIPEELAQNSANAYRHYRKIQHEFRLQGQENVRIPAEQIHENIASVRALWESVFHDVVPEVKP